MGVIVKSARWGGCSGLQVFAQRTWGSPRPFATPEAFGEEVVARVGTAPVTDGRG
ncbi:hypothetical protein AB0N06_29845 [Streptomyces sp. NPDC051020]|uniref:hypothetical protein n=1 Tax=Streptomyces sp. NPDC051020 TaxID=3155409 RepID=UPI003448EF0E